MNRPKITSNITSDQTEKKEVLNQVSDEDLRKAITNYFEGKVQYFKNDSKENGMFNSTMLEQIKTIKDNTEKYGGTFFKNEKGEIMVRGYWKTGNGQSIECPLGFILDKKPGEGWSRGFDTLKHEPNIRLSEGNNSKEEQWGNAEKFKVRLLQTDDELEDIKEVIKYSDHRGSLEESMSTCQDFTSIQDLKNHLIGQSITGDEIEDISFKKVGFDKRINRNTYNVIIKTKAGKEYVAGQSNGILKEKSLKKPM